MSARIVAHPTTVGMWLIPDTEKGRQLMEEVPASKAIRLAASPFALGMMAAGGISIGLLWLLSWLGGASMSVSAGAWIVCVTFFVVAGGVTFWIQARQERRRMRLLQSGIAVPAPLEMVGARHDPELGPGLSLPAELAFNAPRLVRKFEQLADSHGDDVLAVLWTAGRAGTMDEVVQALGEELEAKGKEAEELRVVEAQARQAFNRSLLQEARGAIAGARR